jgi:hypothetical protein
METNDPSLEMAKRLARERGIPYFWYIRSAEAVSAPYQDEDDLDVMTRLIQERRLKTLLKMKGNVNGQQE